MKYQEVATKLHKLGCQEIPRRGSGSHRRYNPSHGAIAPVPNWGNKDLKIGTLRQIVRILGLDWEDFKRV